MNNTIVEVTNLKKFFPLGGGLFKTPELVRAVDDISFTMEEIGRASCRERV